MKKRFCLLFLALCLCLLPACGAARSGGTDSPPEAGGAAPVASQAEDETPAYLTCRIVDGAEDGVLLLAALDAPLYGGHEGLNDGQSVYRLPLQEGMAVYLDGKPASAGDLRDGMPLEVSFSGNILETFPAQLGEAYEVRGFSAGTRQCPGGSL